MIPAREDIPEEEQLGWITARLADPYFDWRTPLAHPRPGRRGSGAPATPASDVGEVLDIWQRINDSERRARFLASPALGDLVQFPVAFSGNADAVCTRRMAVCCSMTGRRSAPCQG